MQEQFGASGGGIDMVRLKQYLHIIVRRIWIVAICFTIALVLSIIKVSKQEAVYRASTTLLLKRGTPMPVQAGGPSERQVYGEFIDTQVRIFYSQAVIARARERLMLSEEEVSQKLRRINAFVVGKSSLISISVDALDSHFAANYANSIAAAYMDFKAEEQSTSSQNTTINLTQQANRIRDELRKAEDALVRFKRENAFVYAGGRENVSASIMRNVGMRAAAHRLERMIMETQRPMLTDASDDVILSAIGSRYVAAAPYAGPSQVPSQGYEVDAARNSNANRASEASPLGVVRFDEDGEYSEWQSLRRRKELLEYELRAARENLRDEHPQVRHLLSEIKDVDSSIDHEVQVATRNYFSDLEAASLKEQALLKVEQQWLNEALEDELLSDQFRNLSGDVERLRRMLEAVLSKIRDVDISSGIIPDTVTVMDEASSRSNPLTPRKVQSVFLAGLIGIAIGIGIIFGIDLLDDSLRYPEEIPKVLGLKFLGLIPAANWSTSDIRSHLLSQIDPKSGLAESYRNIRAILMQQEPTRNSKTMLITSSLPKEGKTTTSLNMAISFAQAGMRVLLVDADLRRGEVHKYFGLEGGRGFSDVLQGQAKAESVIQRSGVNNLDLVATGPFPVNPAELMLRPEFRTFIEYAKRSYDKIIFDGPPVMAVSESGVLASMVESTVMVVWAANTSRKICQVTLQNLLQRGARVDGCVLNNLEFGRTGYYYYSTYYGYYTYDYRYDDEARPG